MDSQQVMRSFFDQWRVPDLDAMVALLSEQIVYENVPSATRLLGRDAFRAWFSEGIAVLDRIEIRIVNIVANGDLVMTERIDDHIAGDRHMVLPVMNVSRVVDGRIVEYRDYFDRDTVRAIGLA